MPKCRPPWRDRIWPDFAQVSPKDTRIRHQIWANNRSWPKSDFASDAPMAAPPSGTTQLGACLAPDHMHEVDKHASQLSCATAATCACSYTITALGDADKTSGIPCDKHDEQIEASQRARANVLDSRSVSPGSPPRANRGISARSLKRTRFEECVAGKPANPLNLDL